MTTTATMDRVRSAFNNVIKSERYSRFTLQPMDDGESHVEVKLSDDATDDAVEVEGQAGGSPSYRPALLHQNWRNICYLALGILMIFVTGYLVGYISHRKPRVEPGNAEPGNAEPVTPPADFAPAPEFHLDWKDITELLTQKLTSQAFDKTLRDFDLPRRSAGSAEDMNLANRIFDEFKRLEMDPWTDRHYVQLQMPDSNRPNRVLFGSNVFEPVGYLAYSAPGKVQGKLVYGNYGRQEDLDVLQKKNVELKDSVLLLRSGKISFAEQVDNAATKGASAVLIYPDSQDYKYQADTALYGHVHLGSGDPYTPGFPSFNHTQFPPTQSSGLPKIPAQTITANMASTLLQKIYGPESDASSGFKGGFRSVSYRLGGIENITVEVNNVLVNREIHNVFGVIKGFSDPDRYVVLGAQRDAWGKGYARATVGSSILLELAKAVHEMVENDGFRPRRSLVFASWTAGEYGNVGATEWLEGYMSSIDKSVFTYISLDGAVMGRGSFMASASPLLFSLIERTMKEVKSPLGSGTVYDMVGRKNWEANTLKPMSIDDPAYPFLAFSGIPSISFHFMSPDTESYTYYGTSLDNMDHLDYQTNHCTSEMTAVAAQFAGQMAVRLVHDHLLSLDVSRYSSILTTAVAQIYKRINQLLRSGQLKDVSPSWLNRARGSFYRAADSINRAVVNTDLNDKEACRIINDRIMRVEHTLLSPYVSPIETPFRHLVLGRGSHTLASIAEATDMERLRTQLALATWNLQGCANAMVGNIWDIDNEI
ncbi:transferrin receptor 1b [Xiphias gladius]|uniref:transferrin receptor 1b n=1 Tax=Xiphias gladius TaxID=8245 RepID=UPI001A97E43B|nr:transferrin receptor 1b [Xiphias gladius]XP_039982272.1 transferrin receptor 1b [Xiphias gladius]XP_039982273.1 transferrin receptor 1b [Xiphias gladius]